ncbi:hypothetical protein ILYODFUR_026138, partial [Ilyodon furcidens]
MRRRNQFRLVCTPRRFIPPLTDDAHACLSSPHKHNATNHLRRAMGTKMSFGRGSGDQNTDSHLTSASPPCSFVHTPSDCKQIPDDERGSEDINATDMNQTALRASEHVESDVHLSSKITDRSCRPSEDTLSQ